MLGALSGCRSGRQEDQSECHFGWADEDACCVRDRRFPLHSEVERIQYAIAAKSDARRSWKSRRVFPFRHVERGDGRNPSRRCRLPHCGNQEPRRAGYHTRQGQLAAMAPLIVYYVRHGETDWNVAGRLQGRRDVSLNARGRAQATRCGDILHGLFTRQDRDPAGLDYVSSPLKRARETMELLRESLGLLPDGYRLDKRLTEISFGEWEGFTIAQLRMCDPQRVAVREH